MNNRPNNPVQEEKSFKSDRCAGLIVGMMGSGLAGGIYNAAAYGIGNALLQANDWNNTVSVPLAAGMVSGAIIGAATGPIFIGTYGENNRLGFSPFARKYSPAITVCLSILNEVIAQGFYYIPEFCKLNADGSSPDYYLDKPLFDKTSMVVPTVIGSLMLTCGFFITYESYKLIKRRFALNEPANLPLVAEPIVEPAEIPYQPLNAEPNENQNPEGQPAEAVQPAKLKTIRDELDAFYKGKIPEKFKDPIHLGLMIDPIMLECGHNIDRESLADIKKIKCECPLCRAPIQAIDFQKPRPNVYVRGEIIKWFEKKKRLSQEIKKNNENENLNGEVKLDNEAEGSVAIQINNFEFVQSQSQAIATEVKEEKLNLSNQEKFNLLNISTLSLNKQFLCPLTKQIMNNPVRASDGIVYEKTAITEYIFNKQNLKLPILSPVTEEPLTSRKGRWYRPANDIEVLIDRFFEYKAKKSDLTSNSLFSRIYNWASSKPNDNKVSFRV